MGSGAVPRRTGLTAIWHPSPNRGARRDGAIPDLVVLHFTQMADARSARDRLCDPACEVSSHYLIAADGTAIQMVDEADRAWHAGAGAWGAVRDVNSRSIGIELDNDGRSAFAAPLMDRLESLLADILHRRAIPPHRVIGHSDCAPGRKVDPGPFFDWPRLARAGLAISVLPEPHGSAGFTRDMARAGYTGSADPGHLLTALRLRHRPRATGPLDARDRGIARALARRFPVDGAVPAD